MASTSLPYPSLQLQTPTQRSSNLPSRPFSRRLSLRPVSASVSGSPSDRLDYFYNQGRDEFFKSRIQKHRSTVYRVNMPPGPFISHNPNVIVLLDGKSFPVLFDVTMVEKRDLFTGTYMSSVELTGGYRVLSYLDPSEPNHGKLKKLMFFLLKSSRDRVIPEFHTSFTELFEKLESELASKGKGSFVEANDQAAFNFLARSLYGVNPAETQLGQDGPKLVSKWVLFQLGPLLVIGLPKLVEELLIHTFPLPPVLVKKGLSETLRFLLQFIDHRPRRSRENRSLTRRGLPQSLIRDLLQFLWGNENSLPKHDQVDREIRCQTPHTRLAEEIRTAVKSNGGKVTMAAMEQMPLTKSVVYEALRIEPPVPLQYGRAKRDMVIESHDSAFEVKEGEMLFGFQPFATKDPKIFDRPEEFVPDRFVCEEGESMLKHVLWSNGPETESPTVGNKQCAGKDFVVLVSRLLLVELFLRYDSFEIEVGRSALGASVTVTSLKRASF
ncbi:allene oxide synthase [Actinidia rufa]|uniref:Allene oxide synthase n=1 Tax=Actinidia rufa TaxID=165716 RepID=A0A7J0GHM2_9ERIC|nr:allene oxide synthase [Actinidia rufa]